MFIDTIIDSTTESEFHVMHFGNDRAAEVTQVNGDFHVEMFTNDGVRHFDILMSASDVRSFVRSWIITGIPTFDFVELE